MFNIRWYYGSNNKFKTHSSINELAQSDNWMSDHDRAFVSIVPSIIERARREISAVDRASVEYTIGAWKTIYS